MLKVLGRFNNFPKDFEQPKLEKGKVARYRLTDLWQDPNDPKKMRFNSSTKIRSIAQITIGDGVYDIGLVRQVSKEGDVVDVKMINIMGQQNAGYFNCTGGTIADDELYSFYELTNENESNPNRDISVKPLFKRVDDEKDAEVGRKKRTQKLRAMNLANDMTLAEVRQFASAKGWDENDGEKILRDRIEKMAEDTPDIFEKSLNDKDSVIKATVKRALDKGAITFDAEKSRWCWATGETICVIAKKETADDRIDGCADWIKSSKKGGAVYDEMIKLSK